MMPTLWVEFHIPTDVTIARALPNSHAQTPPPKEKDEVVSSLMLSEVYRLVEGIPATVANHSYVHN